MVYLKIPQSAHLRHIINASVGKHRASAYANLLRQGYGGQEASVDKPTYAIY